MATKYSRSVFVNCPFDKDFAPLLQPLLFTVVYAGFNPRIASASQDSGEARLSKIVSLIKNSKYSIHDLSRIRAKKAGEFFRLNMPFELGLDVGCRLFSGGKRAKKKCLILERKKYEYQKALSDISNSDIQAHNNEAAQVVRAVRNWIASTTGISVAGPERMWFFYNDFVADTEAKLKANGFSSKDIDKITMSELLTHMRAWVKKNKKK